MFVIVVAPDVPNSNLMFSSPVFIVFSSVVDTMAVFILEDALSVLTNLGHSLFVWLFVAQDALCVWTNYLLLCVVQGEQRKSSSRRIMRLVPVFILRRRRTRRTTNVCPSSNLNNHQEKVVTRKKVKELFTAVCKKGVY